MSLHLRSSLNRGNSTSSALLAANKNRSGGHHQKTAVLISQLVSLRQCHRPSGKYANNIITSPHGDDCTLRELTMVQRFFENASRWPNKIAMECGITGRNYTYETTTRLVKRYGSALTRMGFKKGQVMAIVSPNVAEYAIALLGASAAGMPVTLIDPTRTPDEIARQLSSVGATAMFGVAPMARGLEQVAQLCPTIRNVILLGPNQDGFVSFQQMVQDSGDMFNENLHIDIEKDVFILPHTSGTTGMPKGVMLTHANVGANVSQNVHPGCSSSQMATDCHQEVNICQLPFFHSFGANGVMQTAFELGAKTVTLPRFDTRSYLKAINDHKPTVLHIVPTLAQVFIDNPSLKMKSFERLHTIFSTGSPLGTNTAFKILEKFHNTGVAIQEGYGLSEMTAGAMLTPTDNSQLGSCGRLVSRTKAKIVDLKTGKMNLGPRQQGELYLNGPQVMKGYLNNPKATKETIDGEGWLRTGDVAYYDEDGNFYIVDRLNELIKDNNGMQISPAELEDIITKHPAVAEAAVVGIHDNYEGEIPRAYVVKKPGMESVKQAEITSFVNNNVAAHKRIQGGIEFRQSIPRNHTGKILRRELKAQYSHEKLAEEYSHHISSFINYN